MAEEKAPNATPARRNRAHGNGIQETAAQAVGRSVLGNAKALLGVSKSDRAVLHDSLLPSVVMRRFAVEVAADAMRQADHFDQRSWAALDATMAYERGEIGDAAWYAAWAAARDAAWYAARDAARATARSAACAAQIAVLRQITLRWLGGEDIAEGLES